MQSRFSVSRWTPRRARWRCGVCVLFLLCPILPAAAAIQYFYDDIGRLVLVVNHDGSAITYEHDANGNLTATTHWAGSTPIVATFSPAAGIAGAQVTVSGSAFDPTPANNAVTIGGVSASVVSASETALVVTVPSGASTGPVAVTVAGETGTSAQSFTVWVPTISSVSPLIVDPGATVTLTGWNLNLAPGSTSVSVLGNSATITSISNSQISFDAPTMGIGPVTVSTSYGQAVSSDTLVIIPSAIGSENIEQYESTEFGASTVNLSVSQSSQYGVIEFDAVAGDLVTLHIESLVKSPPSYSVAYIVYPPSGSQYGDYLGTAPETIHLPPMTETGRYLLVFDPVSAISFTVSARLTLSPTLDTAGSPVSVATTYSDESTRSAFSASTGDNLGLGLTSLSVSEGNRVRWRVYRPNGLGLFGITDCYVTWNPGCRLPLNDLPDTGTYWVYVEPYDSDATMSFDLTLTADIEASLTAGTPQAVTFDLPGRQALLTFGAAANDTVALQVGSLAMTPAGKTVRIFIYDPSGTQIVNTTTAADKTFNLTDLSAGTYEVLVVPQDASTGTLDVTLAAGLVGTLPVDGTSQSFASALPDQNGYFTFSASSGDNLGLGLTNLSVSDGNRVKWRVYRPNGIGLFGLTDCYVTWNPGCRLILDDLPDTGTYEVYIEPYDADATMSFDLTLSADIEAPLALDTPQTVTFDVPGRQAVLSFTASAGQDPALNLDSFSMTPTGKSIRIFVYNPAGAQIVNTTKTTTATINLTNLSAGTYTVLLVPADASTGSVEVELL